MLILLSFRTETNLIQVTNFKRNVVKSLLRVLFIEKVLALVHLTSRKEERLWMEYK